MRLNQAGNHMFNVNNRNTRTSCEICSKLTIKTPERCQWCCSGVFVNFKHILHLYKMARGKKKYVNKNLNNNSSIPT